MTHEGKSRLRKAVGSGCDLSDDLTVLEEEAEYDWDAYKNRAAIDLRMFERRGHST